MKDKVVKLTESAGVVMNPRAELCDLPAAKLTLLVSRAANSRPPLTCTDEWDGRHNDPEWQIVRGDSPNPNLTLEAGAA
jgi:hypothetical protein